MKKILIVALYKKEQTGANPLVGIFLDDLTSPPVESVCLKPDRDDAVAEFEIAAKLYALIQDYHYRVSISFSEEIKTQIIIDKDKHQKLYFIKPENFFDFEVVIKKLKI